MGTLEQDGDVLRGSVKATFPSGTVIALLNAAACGDAGVSSGAAPLCTQYPPCLEGSVGACITMP